MSHVCVIIGSGPGLGKSLTKKFAQKGFNIALVSRSEVNNQKNIDDAKKINPEIEIKHFSADANYPKTLEKVMKKVIKEFGDIDVLIYNVRDEFKAAKPENLDIEDLERIFRLEVVSAFAAAKEALKNMRKIGKGTVFFSSATAAFRGSAEYPLYSIGKFGLRALSQSLAKAYGRDGIHFVHVRLDCDLDVPIMRDLYGSRAKSRKLADPDEIAQSYWLTHLQPRQAWSNEIEFRPFTEKWTI